MRAYVSASKIKFIFMTDGGDSYPMEEVNLIKELKNKNPNRIEYSGIEFKVSGHTMKLISSELGGTNTISYNTAQLASAYIEIINRA